MKPAKSKIKKFKPMKVGVESEKKKVKEMPGLSMKLKKKPRKTSPRMY